MDEVQGNGRMLAVHEFRLKSLDEKLNIIFEKLDEALPEVAVHRSQIQDLMSWRIWATGIGTTFMIGVAALFLNHMVGR